MNISSGKVPSAQKVVIYGPEGIGKSTFASKFPYPVFSDTEGSTKKLDVQRFDPPKSFEALKEQAIYVRNNPGICKTYVIDTFDWAERLATKEVCAKSKKSSIEEFGYGKGYVYLNETLGGLLNILDEIIERNINVVITAHAQMRKFEQPDEFGSYDRWELKLDKRNSQMLKEWADTVLFANYKTFVVHGDNDKVKAQGGKRVMYTTHNPCWDAKNRDNLPDELSFEYSAVQHIIEHNAAPATLSESKTIPTVNPTETPIPEIIPEAENTVAENTTLDIPPLTDGYPPQVAQLMVGSGITDEELRKTVATKGYYPYDTPVINYDPQFIDGWIVAFWQNIVDFVNNNIRIGKGE